MDETRWPGRQRLRLVVETEGGEIAPVGIAARKLDRSRTEHEAEEEPLHEKQRRCRRPPGAQARAPGERSEEDGQEYRVEQQDVPLEFEEGLTGHGKREVEEPGEPEAERGSDSRGQKQRD